jgi:formylmethanofuran dehydrogenase subunit C
MGEVVLTFKGLSGSPIPLEADSINPMLFRDRERKEIERVPLHHGNTSVPLGELFSIRGSPSGDLRIEGDLASVKGLGIGMSGGRMVIEGNVGMHVGAGMTGGEIEVRGDAADWAGAEMSGGLLRVRGNAGNRAGSAYRGSRFGMRGGVILIHGSAGHEVGGYMRRGLVAVQGDVADFAGARMAAGTILLFGRSGLRTGGGMNRGTIVCFGKAELLPTFRLASTYTPLVLEILLRALRARGYSIDGVEPLPRFDRYYGDLAELGRGEIFVRRD